MALINILNKIGDAIREKTGGTELIPLKEMADVVRSISGGESVEHSSITYNDDDTITLIETNGKVHTMSCEYENGKLVGLTYDDEKIDLTYENDTLVGIGDVSIDVENAPTTSSTDTRLKDFIEGNLTELVDDTITSVRRQAFAYSKIQKVDLPNCKSIENSGFMVCNFLSSINLPNCESCGNDAFYNCSILEEIELPSATTLAQNCFYSCVKLKKITLNSAISLGNQCFHNCKALTTLIIKTNQVATLGKNYPFNDTPIKSGTGYIYVPDDLVEDYKVASVWSTYATQIKGLSELGGDAQ